MTFGRPKTIGSELITHVENLFEDQVPNRFELRRLKAEAEKLAHVDAYEASIIKSALAALEWEKERAGYWVRNSCSLRHDAKTHLNAAIAFRYLNDLDQGLKYVEIALTLAPQDSFIALQSAELMMLAGRISIAREILVNLKEHNGEVISLIDYTDYLLKALHRTKVSELQLQNEIRIATQVAAARHIRILSLGHFVCEDPGGDINYLVSVFFRGNIDDEISLEFALAEILVADENWNPLKLSVEFTYRENENELYAN